MFINPLINSTFIRYATNKKLEDLTFPSYSANIIIEIGTTDKRLIQIHISVTKSNRNPLAEGRLLFRMINICY